MGWFDEQIKQRVQQDNDVFSDAFAKLAGVVAGDKISRVLDDDYSYTQDAIDVILKYYHARPASLPGDDGNDMDVKDRLEYILRPSGIMQRCVKLQGTWYEDAVGAMLGFRRDNGTPVALLPGRWSGYRYFDAESRKWIRIHSRNAALIGEDAICFYRPLPLRKISIRDLLQYMVSCLTAGDFAMLGLSTLAITALGLLLPKMQQLIYGPVIERKSLRFLLAVFGCMVCLQLSQVLIGAAKKLAMNRLGRKTNVQVEAACMMRILSLPAAFFREYSSGDLANRMGYMTSLCSMLSDALLTTGLTCLFSLMYIAQMASYGPGLVLPGIAVIIGTVLISVCTTLLQIQVSRQQMELSAKEAGLEYSLVSSIQKIRLAGAEKRAFAKWADAYARPARLQYDPPAFLKFSSVATSCISLVGSIVIYFFAVRTGVLLADYYAFNSAYGMVMGAFAMLVGMAETLAQIKPILQMLQPILDAEPEISEHKKMISQLSGNIELSHISFRYNEKGPLVLDDLSLKIRAGQYVAIVGATGCGKSTLMRLLLGFETPQKGAVYYNGQDLTTLDLRSVRRNIGTVMQNGRLFYGDIYSNIVISAPHLTMEDAWEAARLAGLDDDIRAMPMGMHTLIYEGTGGISGGQKQRLMIARAIAPKPQILMLDEATSALDNITQKLVSDSLESLHCTRVVIAHRLSTIRHCDRIVVLDGGRVAEDGTYEELLAQKGIFAELVARQRLEGE